MNSYGWISPMDSKFKLQLIVIEFGLHITFFNLYLIRICDCNYPWHNYRSLSSRSWYDRRDNIIDVLYLIWDQERRRVLLLQSLQLIT